MLKLNIFIYVTFSLKKRKKPSSLQKPFYEFKAFYYFYHFSLPNLLFIKII